MGIEVRTITAHELTAWTEGLRVGFLTQVVEDEAERLRPAIDLDRTWGAFDGGRVVGTLRSIAGSMTVPGGQFVPTALLTAVAVTATHRRQGLLTAMLEPDLRRSKDLGEPLGALIAAEYPIYGRFGYGPASEHLNFTVDATRGRLRVTPHGSVELVDAKTLRGEAEAIWDRHRAAAVGELAWTPLLWDWHLGLAPAPFKHAVDKQFFLLARDGQGQPTGFVIYRVEDTWEARVPRVRLQLDQLVSDSRNGLALLWQYLLQMDWVTHIAVEDRGPDDLLPWLLVDSRHARLTQRTDFLWVRVLDTPSALGTRSYTTPGRVVVEVVDGLGLAGGRFVLEGGPDGATCRPTRATAAITLPVDTLGAVFLGGVSLRTLAHAGRLDEHTVGAVERTDAMFRTPVAPWCSTWF